MGKQNTPKIGEVDLFGAPVNQLRERWGRPSKIKTPENQQLVAGLRAAGWTQVRIAAYMKCDEKTLRTHFSRELQAGADIVEGQTIEVMIAQMRMGRAWATKGLNEMCQKGAAVAAGDTEGATEGKTEEAASAAPLGKKEELSLNAKTPGGSWSRRLN